MNTFLLGFLGIFSGILSAYFFDAEIANNTILNPTTLAPGFIFGLVLGLYFFFKEKISLVRLLKLIAFIFISTTAFLVALSIYLDLPFSPILNMFYIPFITDGSLFLIIFSGFIGGTILVFGVHLLLFKLSFKNFLVLIFLAGLLSLSLVISGGVSGDFDMVNLFIIWQAGLAFALGFVLDKFKKPSKHLKEG